MNQPISDPSKRRNGGYRTDLASGILQLCVMQAGFRLEDLLLSVVRSAQGAVVRRYVDV